jgi:hypothetical protein
MWDLGVEPDAFENAINQRLEAPAIDVLEVVGRDDMDVGKQVCRIVRGSSDPPFERPPVMPIL